MLASLAGFIASVGLLVGVVAAFVPGVSGATLAWGALCVAAFLRGGVPLDALWVAGACALVSRFGQLGLAMVGARWLSAAPAVASGALAGAAFGRPLAWLLGAPWGGVLGALLGGLVGPGKWASRATAIAVVFPTTMAAVALDFLATLGVGAVWGALHALA